MAPIIDVAGVSLVEQCLTTNHRTGPRGVFLQTLNADGTAVLLPDGAGALAATLAVYALKLGARFEPAAKAAGHAANVLHYFAPAMWPASMDPDNAPASGPGSLDDMKKACITLGAIMARYHAGASGYSHAMALVARDLATLAQMREGMEH